MKTWIPCELHTHTKHSDGRFELIELVNAAKETGLECIALTDHNTVSGLMDRENVTGQTGIHIIKGMEWTTFHGHLVALGLEKYEDWRGLHIDSLHEGISKWHKQGAIVGIAHPYSIGSPLCTGCYWNYKVDDWNEIDYIEVWSGLLPGNKDKNLRAMMLWNGLLDMGFRNTAVSGRDWHGPDTSSEPNAVTYIGIDQDEKTSLDKAIIRAIKEGSVSVTVGPLLLINLRLPSTDKTYGIGQEIAPGEYSGNLELDIDLDCSVRAGKWKLDSGNMTLTIMSNLGILAEYPININKRHLTAGISTQGLKWLRGELIGETCGKRTILAFTNPIYFR